MDYLELMGYLASILVLISLSLVSIVKFRIINFMGAALFSTYGFLINAIPVGIVNGLIALIDLYYLFRIINKKEHFEILEVSPSNEYLLKFLNFYKNDLEKFYPCIYNLTLNDKKCLLILRNMKISGVFIGEVFENKMLIIVDYVTPEYRDFKNAKFLYDWLKKTYNISTFEIQTKNKEIKKYFKKIGFIELENNILQKKNEC